MVDHTDADELPRFAEALGELAVLCARCRISARVIVSRSNAAELPAMAGLKTSLGYVAAPFMWSSAHRTPDFLQRVPFRRNISWPAWRRNASKEADYARQAIRNRICRRPAQSRAIRCLRASDLGASRPAAQIDSGSAKQRIPIDCMLRREGDRRASPRKIGR